MIGQFLEEIMYLPFVFETWPPAITLFSVHVFIVPFTQILEQ